MEVQSLIKDYDITMDIKGRSNIPRIECVQGDTNSYRLNISLIDKSPTNCPNKSDDPDGLQESG